jgi:hypothetical protein
MKLRSSLDLVRFHSVTPEISPDRIIFTKVFFNRPDGTQESARY